MLKIFFLLFMSSGLPVAIAMAGASLAYILISATCRRSSSSTGW
jgi:hypothetical protein